MKIVIIMLLTSSCVMTLGGLNSCPRRDFDYICRGYGNQAYEPGISIYDTESDKWFPKEN